MRTEKSGDVVRMLESEFGQLAPEAQAELAAQLNGPAGPAILRQLVLSEFLSMMSADESEWTEAWRARPGKIRCARCRRGSTSEWDPAMPADDGSHDAEADAFFSALSSDASRLLFGVVARATSELEGAINLMVYDNGAAMEREIEAVIARVK